MTADNSSSKDHEWEERTLCSDEACIGVIGPNGRCNECGKPYAGRPAGADEALEGDLSLASEPLLDEMDGDDGEIPTDDALEGDALEGDALGDDVLEGDLGSHWEDRILCRDESCIGVIGPDGRCKECGKPLDDDED